MSNPLSNLTFHSPTLYEIDNSDFINLLERTIINNNEQNRLAQQTATELSNTITAMNVHHSIAGVKNKLYNDLNTLVDNTLQNYGGNLKYATNEIIRQSGEVVRKMQPFVKSNDDYEKWVASIKSNPDIDADTKEFILNDPKNQYHFDAKVINENGEEQYIDNWQIGDNDNIIGYKPWQAGREPLAQVNLGDIVLGVMKHLVPNEKDWQYRIYKDGNGNVLQGADIINATHYIDSSGNEKSITPDMINKASKVYLNANPQIVASLRQDYDKAIYFSRKGDDKYNVRQGQNSEMDFEQYLNSKINGFGEAFSYNNKSSNSIANILTSNSSSKSGGDSSGNNNYSDFVSRNGTVGTISRKVNAVDMNLDRVTDLNNIYSYSDVIMTNNNIPLTGLTSAKDRLNLLEEYKDDLDDETYTNLKDVLLEAEDYERQINVFNENILSRATPEEQEYVNQFNRLETGDYINNEDDIEFANLYNSFFTENGEIVSNKTIQPMTEEFGAYIYKLANDKNINLADYGINYNNSNNTYNVKHDPVSFKVFATLWNDAAANKRGVWKQIDLISEEITKPRYGIESIYTEDTPLYSIYKFGKAYNKVRDKKDAISVKIGASNYNKPIEINQLHNYSAAVKEARGEENVVINRDREDHIANLRSLNLNDYKVYASQELINYLNNDKNKNDIETELIDVGNNDELKYKLQNAITNNDIQPSFVDIPNIGVGDVIKVTLEDKSFTMFVKTFDEHHNGLDSYEQNYFRQTTSQREIDKLELGADENGNNRYTTTLNLGINDKYQMGYTNGTYHINGRAISKNDLIKLVDFRNNIQEEAKQLYKDRNAENYWDYVNNELFKQNENGEYISEYFNQYSDVIRILANVTGKPINVIKRDMINNLLNYY